MRGRVQKWGNSAAVRLPVGVLESAHLGVDQEVEITVEKGTVVIRPLTPAPRYSLQELLAQVTPSNLNLDEEWEQAEPVGSER